MEAGWQKLSSLSHNQRAHDDFHICRERRYQPSTQSTSGSNLEMDFEFTKAYWNFKCFLFGLEWGGKIRTFGHRNVMSPHLFKYSIYLIFGQIRPISILQPNVFFLTNSWYHTRFFPSSLGVFKILGCDAEILDIRYRIILSSFFHDWRTTFYNITHSWNRHHLCIK